MEYKGNLVINDKKIKIAIIVSKFNELITSKLLEGALNCIETFDLKENNYDIFWVPGSFEIPIIAKKIAKNKKYNSIICLGAIIKGETDHYDFVAKEVSKGILEVGLNSEIPTIFGILTCDNSEQALDRAGIKSGNKGYESVLAAIEMMNLIKKI